MFPGTTTHPPLTYQDVLAVLPFQVDARTFVLATYVMSRNILESFQPVSFDVRISGLNGTDAQLRYVDHRRLAGRLPVMSEKAMVARHVEMLDLDRRRHGLHDHEEEESASDEVRDELSPRGRSTAAGASRCTFGARGG